MTPALRSRGVGGGLNGTQLAPRSGSAHWRGNGGRDERARNPAWGVETEPEFLYRLPTGEAWRQRLVEMQEEAAACEK